MSIFSPQNASHPFLPILALATWSWFCLLVKWAGCHNFLHVLNRLPSHLGSHYSRFVLCYSTSASPSQSFCCVQQTTFHDCYVCEPLQVILLGSCAVSWEMAGSGCRVFTALGGTQESLHCSWWMPGTLELAVPGTDSIQPLAAEADGAVLRALLHAECVPVIALGGQTGCLLLLWLPRKCSVNSTLSFLMCSTSLWSSGELSWRGEQNTAWVISQSFCSRCLAESAYPPFLTHSPFLPHFSSFFGLLFNKGLFYRKRLVSLLFAICLPFFPSRSSACSAGDKLAGKDDLEILCAATLLWQHGIKSISFQENEGEESAEQHLGRKEREDSQIQCCFKSNFVLALLHQNESTISYGKDISPSFEGKKRSTVGSGWGFFIIIKKDKQTLWLASIVRTATVSWHSSVSSHVSYVVCLL